MPNVKISALTAITGASVDQANDVIPIVDATGPETKKIKVGELIGLANPGLTYTAVNITSADILQFNSVAKVLLTAPTLPNTYYDIERISVEYTHVTTAYTITPNDAIYVGMDSIGNGQCTFVSGLMLTTASNSVMCGFNLNPAGIDPLTNLSVGQFNAVQEPLVMGTILGDPTLGDGTMKVKIWYYIRTFG